MVRLLDRLERPQEPISQIGGQAGLEGFGSHFAALLTLMVLPTPCLVIERRANRPVAPGTA
jgi:hypothetical protein